MAVFLNENSLISALEEVAGSVVSAVAFLGIDAVELTHADGYIGVWRLDHEAVDEAIGMVEPVVAFDDGTQSGEKVFPLLVCAEDSIKRLAP